MEHAGSLCYTALMRTNTRRVPFLDLDAQNKPLRAEIESAIARVVDTNAFILGPALQDFEAAFASYCGAAHCVGVNSGTAALQLMLQAAGIGPGDEVVTAPNTFIATTEAIAAVGATPVLADVDPKTWLLDAGKAAAAITPRTKALLPVHLYGHVVDMAAFRELAADRGILLLEDAAQAHGATDGGRRVGEGSHGAAFSFYPGKNLGAFGDGGAFVSDDEELARKVAALRHHGQLEKNIHRLVGTTGRLDSIQAAVLGVKLPHLEGWNAGRRKNAALYQELLAGSGYSMPQPREGTDPVYHLFVVNHPDHLAVKAKLDEEGIGWGQHYPQAIHLQPAFSELGKAGDFPVAERICEQIISLPMYAELEEDMVRRVCEVLLKADGRG